jgi:hypothetical protein
MKTHPLFQAVALAACLTACKPDEKSASQPTPAPATPSADAFLVLPGDYAERTTVADFEARFGKANVRNETGPEPRLVLFPDDPTRRAYVTFYEDKAFEHLARISVTDPGSLWRGKQGARIGMTFAEIRELNGKPFSYSGFEEQKRGVAANGWSLAVEGDDGKLGAFDVTEGDRLYFSVDLGVRDPALIKAAADLPVDENLSSDDPRFPKLGDLIIVTGLAAYSSLDDEWE